MKNSKSHNWKYFNKVAEIIKREYRSFIMKKTLVIIFLLFSCISFAQNQPSAVPFDKFINKPSVEWAAYANYNIRFEKPVLNKLLLSRYEKNEIKATEYVWGRSGTTRYFNYRKKQSLDESVFHPHGDVPRYDSLGNQIPSDSRMNVPDFDTIAFTMTEITQMLFIENGELKSYIPWVSAMFPIVTSFGVYLGEGGYFSTCFNFNSNYKPQKGDKNLFFAETKQVIKPDSIADEYRLKEIYGRNMIEAIWPHIFNKKLTFIQPTMLG